MLPVLHLLRGADRRLATLLMLALPLGVPSAESANAMALNPIQAPAATPDASIPTTSEAPRSAARYSITPERRALLNTIRYAEGTWGKGCNEGYRTIYGGGRAESLERHPDILVVKRYASAAAGAYQFLPDTWRSGARKLGLRGFGPANQDQVALHLVEQRGALAAIDRGELSDATLDRLAPEWASLPTLSGHSAYGQPVKSAAELRRFFQGAIQHLRPT